jgi:hypothetical protein
MGDFQLVRVLFPPIYAFDADGKSNLRQSESSVDNFFIFFEAHPGQQSPLKEDVHVACFYPRVSASSAVLFFSFHAA